MNAAGHTRRLKGWDYAKGASFFITMATEPRLPLFGKIEHGEMRLSAFGEEVKVSLERIPALNPGISLFGHVIMPDHVHFNVHLAAGLEEPLITLGEAIRRFKAYTTKRAKQLGLVGAFGLSPTASTCDSGAGKVSDCQRMLNERTAFARSPTASTCDSGAGRVEACQRKLLWQQGYHDHLCLSRGFIDSAERYIAYNPLKWQLMHGCDRRLRIIEPLDSPRLDIGDYWKGVGNISLLAPEAPMASLRVSRRVHDVGAVVARMERAVEKGYTIISGFISPGERAVLAMLLSRKDARFIRMRTSCIPNARFRPESAYIDAFMEERYLEIARGNDETEFDRAACLDLNAEIVRIATAGVGLALYFQPDGLYRIGEDGVWRKENG